MRARFLARASLCLLSLAISVLAGSSAMAQESNRSARHGVRDILSTLETGKTVTEVSDQLLALGMPALPDLFGAWAAGFEGYALTADELSAVQTAIRGLPGPEVLAYLERALVPSKASRREKRTGLLVFAELGGSESVAYMVALGCDGSDDSTALRLQAALAAVARRDPETLDQLREQWLSADPWVKTCLLGAVGQAGMREGFRVLAPLLFSEDMFTSTVLEQVGNIAGQVGPPFTDSLRSDVRPFLYSEDDRVRARAADTAGLLADISSMPRLLEMLEESGPRARGAAQRALKRISGRSFGADVKRWHSWYLGELAWWEDSWPQTRDKLRSEVPAEVLHALRAAIRRQLFRDEIAEEIAVLFFDSDPLVRRLACQSLGQLGSELPLHALVDSLDDPDEQVAHSAHEALMKLTALQLPADYDAWRAALGDRR